MRQRIRIRAMRVVVMLFAIVMVSCDRASELAAPQNPAAAAAAYALNGKEVIQLLNVVDGMDLESTGTVVPRGDARTGALLSLPAANGGNHYLFVEPEAVKKPAEFSMSVKPWTFEYQGQQHTINYLNLTATTLGSTSTNDAGKAGFKARTVVMCLLPPALASGATPQVYWIQNARSIVRMRKVQREGMPDYVCADIPHFSGFVMGAN
jgi:hypothetical protein